jgi:general stress protein 26
VVIRAQLAAFLKSHRLAVQSSVSPSGFPQSAVVGIAVNEALEVVFDTLSTTRKAGNLRINPRISFVVGGLLPGDERTVQYEGVADFLAGEELEQVRQLYFSVWPDGRERLSWPGLIHIRVRPTWIRYSDFNRAPPLIVEFEGAML